MSNGFGEQSRLVNPAVGCEKFFGYLTISVKKMNLECNLSTAGCSNVTSHSNLTIT